jgi:hypothetical protein
MAAGTGNPGSTVQTDQDFKFLLAFLAIIFVYRHFCILFTIILQNWQKLSAAGKYSAPG